MNLDDLLDVVCKKFGPSRGGCYQFTLGRIAGQWRFDVTDCWHKWSNRGLQHHFVSDSPRGAVARFLAYVESNKVKVKELTEKGTQGAKR